MIIEQFNGYSIKKRVRGQKWPVYVQYIHGDRIAYTLDYSAARVYKSKKAALKNNRLIPETLNF